MIICYGIRQRIRSARGRWINVQQNHSVEVPEDMLDGRGMPDSGFMLNHVGTTHPGWSLVGFAAAPQQEQTAAEVARYLQSIMDAPAGSLTYEDALRAELLKLAPGHTLAQGLYMRRIRASVDDVVPILNTNGLVAISKSMAVV